MLFEVYFVLSIYNAIKKIYNNNILDISTKVDMTHAQNFVVLDQLLYHCLM